MQVTANKTTWYSLLVLAATFALSAPTAQAAETLRIVHVTPVISTAGPARSAHSSVKNGQLIQVHGRHGHHRKHRRHANRPRFITEEICHRHGGRRHCHTTVRRVVPQRFGFGKRELNRGFRRGHKHGHRRHGHQRRNRGFNFILNL